MARARRHGAAMATAFRARAVPHAAVRYTSAIPMRRLIEQYPLGRGSHATRSDGMCAMEMVAWLAGEPHSDEPRCACPVLAALVRACNDALGDAQRSRLLRPLVPLLVNTRTTAAGERLRGFVAIDGLVRTLLPRWLVRHRRADEARRCAALPPIDGRSGLLAARRAVAAAAPDQSAAAWVLDRALDGMPPARFVAGVVQVARRSNDAGTWTEVVRLIERMCATVAASPEAASEFADRAVAGG